MINKFCLALVLLLAMLQSGYASETDNRALVEKSIGKLMLMSDAAWSYDEDDSAPFGDAKASHEAVVIYEKHIKHLPEERKVDYFWALMWHFSFYFTSNSPIFSGLILRDCGPAFIRKLEDYIEKEEKLQEGEHRLKFRKGFLQDLKAGQKSGRGFDFRITRNLEVEVPGPKGSDNSILQSSVGKLALTHYPLYSDDNGLYMVDGAKFADHAVTIYEKNIRHLSEKDKVYYFWTIMWNFDSHFTNSFTTFAPLILRDCGSAFFKKLEDYIEKGEKLHSNNIRVKRAKQFLLRLKAFQTSKGSE